MLSLGIRTVLIFKGTVAQVLALNQDQTICNGINSFIKICSYSHQLSKCENKKQYLLQCSGNRCQNTTAFFCQCLIEWNLLVLVLQYRPYLSLSWQPRLIEVISVASPGLACSPMTQEYKLLFYNCNTKLSAWVLGLLLSEEFYFYMCIFSNLEFLEILPVHIICVLTMEQHVSLLEKSQVYMSFVFLQLQETAKRIRSCFILNSHLCCVWEGCGWGIIIQLH